MKPSKDFSERYSAAKKWRDGVRSNIEEAYQFCAPDRAKDFSSLLPNASNDDAETYSSLAEDLAEDLAGDLVTYFTPAESKWYSYQVITEVNEDQADEVLELIKAREDDLGSLIQGSNFYDIAPQWGFETAVHGTPAIWISASHLTQPIHCQSVPPNELLVTPGHLGILDRFRECTVMAGTLAALLEGYQANLSHPDIVKKIQKPGATCVVIWGFWLDWSDMGNPMWRCEITVDGKRVTPSEPLKLGPFAGSCPLHVGRFNPRPNRPWGRGPGIKALRDLRTMNKVSETVLSGLDQSLMNTLIYADDGFLDLSEGIEAGRSYPAHRGFTRDQIVDLSRNVNVDQGWFTEDRMEGRLRSIFYQDGPRQRGDTPPTAAQWIDERRRVQQRIGKPSAPLWSEFFVPIIQRFEFLGIQLGKLTEAISHNGAAISVMPISPLQKAQNQDQVMIARSNMDFAAGVFGENLASVIDSISTMKKMVSESGDTITTVMKEQAVAAPPTAQ